MYTKYVNSTFSFWPWTVSTVRPTKTTYSTSVNISLTFDLISTELVRSEELTVGWAHYFPTLLIANVPQVSPLKSFFILTEISRVTPASQLKHISQITAQYKCNNVFTLLLNLIDINQLNHIGKFSQGLSPHCNQTISIFSLPARSETIKLLISV